MANFYLEGRAENTVKNYGGAFRFVWSHAKEIGRFVFGGGEGEVAGLMVRLPREGRGENMRKKTSAVNASQWKNWRGFRGGGGWGGKGGHHEGGGMAELGGGQLHPAHRGGARD